MNKLKVPQLRFPGFEGAWETNKLSDWKLKVIDGDRGINYPNGDDFSTEGYCLFMNAKNVTKNGFSFETKTFITKEKDEKLRKGKLKRNDLILTTRGSVGNIAFYDESIKFENLRINSGMVLIRNENSNIDSRFIYSSFFTPKLNRIIDTISFGSAQPQLTVKEINLFKFNIPTLPEQQKIASFLSAVDEKIQQLSRKKELLEQYKKGVMQQLFSDKLRFKDENGKDYPDWEEKKLGEVAEKRIAKNKDNRINLVFTNSAVQGIVNQRDFFDKDIANQNNLLGYYIVEKNDFVYNPRISSQAPVGPISRNYLDTGIMSPLYSVFRFREGNLDFIECFFNSIVWHKHMKDISNYGARDDRMSFSTGDFYKMPIPFPCIEEQQKIANFLSSIDAKIENTIGELEKVQLFKKGLLQKMFV